MKLKIKKGDTVEVVSGKETNKGKRGEVIRVNKKNSRLYIQGVNMLKKHQGQVQSQGRTITPGIIEFEGSIHISNLMLVCPKCDEPTRVGIQREDGVATRVCKHCEALID